MYEHHDRVNDIHQNLTKLHNRRTQLFVSIHNMQNSPPTYEDTEEGRILRAADAARFQEWQAEEKVIDLAIKAVLSAAVV